MTADTLALIDLWIAQGALFLLVILLIVWTIQSIRDR